MTTSRYTRPHTHCLQCKVWRFTRWLRMQVTQREAYGMALLVTVGLVLGGPIHV